MCSINGSSLFILVVFVAAIAMFFQQPPTITFDQHTQSAQEKNANRASNGEGSWYMGTANTALQKIKDGLHSVKVID